MNSPQHSPAALRSAAAMSKRLQEASSANGSTGPGSEGRDSAAHRHLRAHASAGRFDATLDLHARACSSSVRLAACQGSEPHPTTPLTYRSLFIMSIRVTVRERPSPKYSEPHLLRQPTSTESALRTGMPPHSRTPQLRPTAPPCWRVLRSTWHSPPSQSPRPSIPQSSEGLSNTTFDSSSTNPRSFASQTRT